MRIVEYFQAFDLAEWRVVGSAPFKAEASAASRPKLTRRPKRSPQRLNPHKAQHRIGDQGSRICHLFELRAVLKQAHWACFSTGTNNHAGTPHARAYGLAGKCCYRLPPESAVSPHEWSITNPAVLQGLQQRLLPVQRSQVRAPILD